MKPPSVCIHCDRKCIKKYTLSCWGCERIVCPSCAALRLLANRQLSPPVNLVYQPNRTMRWVLCTDKFGRRTNHKVPFCKACVVDTVVCNGCERAWCSLGRMPSEPKTNGTAATEHTGHQLTCNKPATPCLFAPRRCTECFLDMPTQCAGCAKEDVFEVTTYTVRKTPYGRN